jgi:hypothetical protein
MNDFVHMLTVCSVKTWEWRASRSGLSIFITMSRTCRRSSRGYAYSVIMLTRLFQLKKFIYAHLLGLVSPIPTSAHRTTSSPRVCCSTASAVHHRRFRLCTLLLMMSMMMPESCSDTNKYTIFLHPVGYLFTFIDTFYLYHNFNLFTWRIFIIFINYQNLVNSHSQKNCTLKRTYVLFKLL